MWLDTTSKRNRQHLFRCSTNEYRQDCKKKMYLELVRDGELEDHLQDRANEARRFAETPIRQGTFAGQAWQWAIRAKLLDSEMD